MSKLKKQNNWGFSLVEIIVSVAIATLILGGISTLYTFYHKQQIIAQRKQSISSSINFIKNMLLSEYKYHRGDNPIINGETNIRPNMNRIRLAEHILERNIVNGINVGRWGNYDHPFPMTQAEMDADAEAAITRGKQEYSNTKLLTIEQLVKQDDGITQVKRIEYSMWCRKLPENIFNRIKSKKTTLRQLLIDANYFASTRCNKNTKTEQGRWHSGFEGEADTAYVTSCFNTTDGNDDKYTVVLRKDVWDNWDDARDWSYGFPTLNANTNGRPNNHTIYQYPNDITNDPNPPILGIAFCTWIPTDEDIMTADNTEIELYYFMLDNDSYMDSTKTPKLEVKTERISLKRDHSITTSISPIK